MLRTSLTRMTATAKAARPLALRLYSTSSGRKYTTSHEWIMIENGVGTMGISHHAQDKLGDIIFVELPKVNEKFEKSMPLCALESVKATAEVYAPVEGTVVEVNTKLTTGKQPGLINSSPLADGWLVKLKVANEKDLANLMNEEEYKKHSGD